MAKGSLKDCSKIFLDTGIILDALRPVSTDERQALIIQLLEHLSNTKSSQNRVRRFYLSAVSLSEISSIENFRSLVTRVSSYLDVSNLEIVSFNKEIALLLSREFANLIPKKVLNEYARKANFPENELHIGREWITRDMMIAATAKHIRADVVFTTEKYNSDNRTTFVGVAQKLDLFCVPTYKEYFLENHGGKPIMEFSGKA